MPGSILNGSERRRLIATAAVFDGDDTLWRTQPLYTSAKRRFFHEMELLGFDPLKVEPLFDRVDIANVRRFGYSKTRFPNSMVETYRRLCRAQRIRPSRLVMPKLEGIGASVFAAAAEIYEGAPAVLAALRSWRVHLALVTKGDRAVQEKRIAESGLAEFFDQVAIVEEKTEHELLQVLERAGSRPDSSWAVGNSVRSDVNPALRVGMFAIWIPNETWHYEADEILDQGRVKVVTSIRDVPMAIEAWISARIAATT